MTHSRTPAARAGPGARLASAGPTRIVDDRWNEQMQRVLREAADTRTVRDRARSLEDLRTARRESAALMALIDGHAANRER